MSMDATTGLGLVAAAVVGLLAVLLILRRQRHEVEADNAPESPYAVSTEGEKRCPRCGMGNLWTDATCISCGAHLPG